ncbi:MAG: glutaredoxin [Gallionella sp.]|nr:glutaredoxin [Gallionella sp.]OIO12458.1 MAG: glutaredoxin [Gallionellaceae bacterium CG1_02_60_325]PIR09669.1 MAG: glutaredoxin [Gallionellaceae bacterium CG11_big_fil_rev_8_21_14_0_20_60_62]PIV48218.1 MAG: glutaredoxin [Gallionellaceae bacterium CG02_land_8_20_14_3_00_60_115]PIY06779.1 MAG: glutaredoxin [Gallionellaceae bacterium CG_4_10_14_3_um_filter_60_1069]PJC05203.1 MAG: glutaredoxin [Gallionellaceae bacterium CG_4_9_14_0_8_um_filter_60_335]
MKWMMRYFFRGLRIVLIPFVLIWEAVTTPKGIVRAPSEQQRIDEQTLGMALYQFKTCPFCVKVRREIRRLSLNIELRDARHDQKNRADLLQGGGSLQVPCLRITDERGNSRWLYESSEINAYLHRHFAALP